MYFLKSKNEAFKYFREYQAEFERQTSRRIKRIRTDQGLEFCANYFENYLRAEGIKIERTNVYSPEMNGVAERLNRTLIEGTRAMLTQAKLPKELWAEIVPTQNYLKNRFPHKKLNNRVLLNVWSGKSFSIRHFKMIGSLAYVFIPKRQRQTRCKS